LLLVPTTLLTLLTLLAPRLLLVAALLRVLLAGTLTPATATLSRLLATLAGLLAALPRLLVTGLLTPTTAALLRRLTLTGLRLGRLLTWLLTWLLATGALAPATATLARLLSPAALTRLTTRLSPLPARLAPRLPRTPRSLWRRRHMRSLETHV
jgi:hypothetical protein